MGLLKEIACSSTRSWKQTLVDSDVHIFFAEKKFSLLRQVRSLATQALDGLERAGGRIATAVCNAREEADQEHRGSAAAGGGGRSGR